MGCNERIAAAADQENGVKMRHVPLLRGWIPTVKWCQFMWLRNHGAKSAADCEMMHGGRLISCYTNPSRALIILFHEISGWANFATTHGLLIPERVYATRNAYGERRIIVIGNR